MDFSQAPECAGLRNISSRQAQDSLQKPQIRYGFLEGGRASIIQQKFFAVIKEMLTRLYDDDSKKLIAIFDQSLEMGDRASLNQLFELIHTISRDTELISLLGRKEFESALQKSAIRSLNSGLSSI